MEAGAIGPVPVTSSAPTTVLRTSPSLALIAGVATLVSNLVGWSLVTRWWELSLDSSSVLPFALILLLPPTLVVLVADVVLFRLERPRPGRTDRRIPGWVLVLCCVLSALVLLATVAAIVAYRNVQFGNFDPGGL
jgi:hypothetical protein